MVSNNALDIQQVGLVKFDGIGTFTGVTVTQHDVLVGGLSNGITSVSPSTANFVLTSNGVGADPSFQDVSASGAAKFITGNSGGALTPTAGNWNIFGASTAAGTSPVTTSGAVSTLTVNVQKSQAIAATDATKIGLAAFDSARFSVDANGFVSINGSGIGETITGNSGGALSPTAGNWNILGASTAAGTSPLSTSGAGSTLTVNVQKSQAIASTDATKVGVAAFDSAFFSVDANGFVTAAASPLAVNYTNVTHAMSPYTVLAADYYISVDCSGGVVTLNFPNAPTAKRTWVIKDRTGSAATSNITITTPGGVVTIDGLTSYTMNSNYQAINLLANATPTYEVY